MDRLSLRLILWFALLLNALVVQAEVVIAPIADGKGFEVTTTAYQAKLDATGAMTSLLVSGEEFFAEERKLNINGAVVDVPAVFASHHRSWTPTFLLTGPVTIDGKTLKTKGEGWDLDYTFEESAFSISFGGFPKGASYALNEGYPNGNLDFWMSPKLHRAVDALQQGDLGWPVKGNPEPGNYTLIAKNGAGVEFQNSFWIATYDDRRPGVQITRRGDFILLADMAKQPKPITRHVKISPKVDLGRSVELSITSPNPDHLFPENRPIVFPVQVTAYYGQSLRGCVGS